MITIKELISDAISKAFNTIKGNMTALETNLIESMAALENRVETRFNDYYMVVPRSGTIQYLRSPTQYDGGSFYYKIDYIVYMCLKYNMNQNASGQLGALAEGYYSGYTGIEFALPGGGYGYITSTGMIVIGDAGDRSGSHAAIISVPVLEESM